MLQEPSNNLAEIYNTLLNTTGVGKVHGQLSVKWMSLISSLYLSLYSVWTDVLAYLQS
jgi:hypothetical protein